MEGWGPNRLIIYPPALLIVRLYTRLQSTYGKPISEHVLGCSLLLLLLLHINLSGGTMREEQSTYMW